MPSYARCIYKQSENMNTTSSTLACFTPLNSLPHKEQLSQQPLPCNPEHFSEEESMDEEEGGVWRSNLMLEDALERHLESVALCKMTSIEENLRLHQVQ